MSELTEDSVRADVRAWLEANWNPELGLVEWRNKLADSGWGVPGWPKEWYGLDLPAGLVPVVDEEFARIGAIGVAKAGIRTLAAATILAHGTDLHKEKYLRRILTGEDTWCQLFSEPGSGSDVAGAVTRAEMQGNKWIVNGQKVWTTSAHHAHWGLLLARTDPDAPKHKGLTYFVLDMHASGVETRPLRQMTGQAEFNEVYITDARIPDIHRLGAVGDGWRVAMTTLMNERSALGASGSRRGGGAIADAVQLWASRPDRHTPVLRDRLTQLWLRSEAQRLTSERSRAAATTTGGPGPEGSIGKMVGAELNQKIYEFCMDLLGPEGLLYHSYSMYGQNAGTGDWRGPVQQRYLRSRANTIEGGTSEVMRNILGERVLGLPGDLRADAGMPWKDVPRG